MDVFTEDEQSENYRLVARTFGFCTWNKLYIYVVPPWLVFVRKLFANNEKYMIALAGGYHVKSFDMLLKIIVEKFDSV